MGLKLGRIVGTSVEISYSWLLIFGVFTYTVAVSYFHRNYPWLSGALHWILAILIALLFFMCLLLHETAHSFYARKTGVPREKVILFLFGGVQKPEREPSSPREEFVSAAVGPAFSLGLAAVFWLAGMFTSPGSAADVLCTWLTAANALVAGFNLLPVFPLDGGRVLRAGIWASAGNYVKATRAASITGQVSGWLMLAAGASAFAGFGYLNGLWLVFAGSFITYASAESYRNLLFKRALEGLAVTNLITHEVETVDSGSTLDELVNGYFLKTYSDIYPVSDDGVVSGVVTLAAVRKVPSSEWGNMRVAAVMSPIKEMEFALVDEDAWQAFERMDSERLDHLFVVDKGKVVGLVKLEDAERSLKSRLQVAGYSERRVTE